jgi:hypothetical protein
MTLIAGIRRRMVLAEGAFVQRRTLEQVTSTLLALLAALGGRTIAGAIVWLGLEQRDWSGRYRHFSRSPWEQTKLFQVAAHEAAELCGDHPFIPVSLDDTALPSTSSKGGMATFGRDPLSPKFHVNLVRGLRHVHAAIIVPHYQDGRRPMAVSTAFDLCVPLKKPKAAAGPEAMAQWKKESRKHTVSAAGLTVLTRQRTWLDEQGLSAKRMLAVVDGSYTNRNVIRGLPANTHLIGRCRKDIVLFEPSEKRRRYGPRAPTPEAMRQDETIPWCKAQCHYAGRSRQIDYKVSGPLRWRATGTDLPILIIVLRPIPYAGPGGHRSYRKPAYLITTDLITPIELLIQAYLDRWQIEVTHRDLKHETRLGSAQVRNAKSVNRLHASVVAANAFMQLAAHELQDRQRGTNLPPLPAWRRVDRRRSASQQELLAQIRMEMQAEMDVSQTTIGNGLKERIALAQAG